MKKLTSVIALLLVFVMLFSACNKNQTPDSTTPEAGTPAATTPTGTTPAETTPAETTPAVTTPGATEPEPVPLEPDCAHLFTSRIVLEQVTTQTDGKIANVCGNCGGWFEEILPAVKSLKILAIGNSFSNNALKYLPILAKELGIEEVIVGKLYVGGCTVDGHWNRAESGADYESFQVNTTGTATWTTYPAGQRSLAFALDLYDWDIITMQQGSPLSGMPDSLGNLQNLIDFVNANKTNPNAKLYWHMTWAYSQFTEHSGFANYNKDQMTMYNAIVDLTKNCIVPNECFTGIIPAGTAVQNYRGKDINNASIERDYITLSDGYHLRDYSEALVAMTWLRTLTGLSLDAIKCNSQSEITFARTYLRSLKKAANNAYLNPYEVNSAY